MGEEHRDGAAHQGVLSRIGISEHSLSSHGTLAGIVEARTRAVLNLEPKQRSVTGPGPAMAHPPGVMGHPPDAEVGVRFVNIR